MSKHDEHFINTVSVVIGILVAITIGIFAFARIIGLPFDQAKASSEGALKAQVHARIAPVGRIAVTGQDNSALAIAAAPAAAGAPGAGPLAAAPRSGAEVYEAVCKTCHAAGLAGAPKYGDPGAWAARLAQGKATLYQHALGGFTGKAGVMPAKGGRVDLGDALVREAVDYMGKAGR